MNDQGAQGVRSGRQLEHGPIGQRSNCTTAHRAHDIFRNPTSRRAALPTRREAAATPASRSPRHGGSTQRAAPGEPRPAPALRSTPCRHPTPCRGKSNAERCAEKASIGDANASALAAAVAPGIGRLAGEATEGGAEAGQRREAHFASDGGDFLSVESRSRFSAVSNWTRATARKLVCARATRAARYAAKARGDARRGAASARATCSGRAAATR